MRKRVFTVLNCSIALLLIAIIALTICVSVSAKSDKLAGANFMASDNLARTASVSGDALGSKKIIDGKNSTSSTLRRRNSAEIIIDLGAAKNINSIILKEDGLNCKSFELSISSDNVAYKMIHKGDKIEYQRLCTFDTVIGRYVKLTILKSDDNVTIREMEIYNEPVRDASKFRVSGYYADNWSSIWLDTALTDDEKQAKTDKLIIDSNMDKLTNLFMYCGMGYNADGDVYLSDNADNNALNIAAMSQIISRLKALSTRNIKLSLTFGSSTGNQVFLTAIDKNKDKFITNLIALCNELGFDGIDIDYEFPFTKSDYALFDAFLIDLKARMITEMDVRGEAILSCAFGTMGINYSEKARKAIDIVNCMTYDIFDQDGQHSSFWSGCVQGAKYLESVGFSKEQISIGIPFYGTQIDALMEQYLYSNLPYTDYYQSEYTVTDYIGKPTQVYFNSPSMARDKTAFALLAGYGGIMTWHSTIDVNVSQPNSLWRAINTAVNDFGGVL